MSKGSMIQVGPDNGKHWLDDGERLCRYVPLKTLFFYLAGNIFLPSVQKLQAGEPFEGESFSDEAWVNSALHKLFGDQHQKITQWIHGKLRKDIQECIEVNRGTEHSGYAFQQYQKWYFEFVVRTRFAWCWYRASKESAAMWSTYGAHGAAIVARVGTIKNVLAEQGCNGGYRQMQYYSLVGNQALGFNPETPEGDELILRPYFLKRDEYASEKEVRFVVVDTSVEWRGGDFILFEKIAPETWIESIVLGPGLTKEQVAALTTAVAQFSKTIRLTASQLHYGRKQELNDRMADLGKLASKGLDDGIPELLKKV